MGFDEDYEAFMNHHMKKRRGERLRRLKDGHGHGEKRFLQQVWWPAIGHFDHLYPEYEASDFRDGLRYLDFAYIRSPFAICFEIDGFNAHAKNIDRWKFVDHNRRQNHLVYDGWMVVRFAYDDIEAHPRRCQQEIQQLFGKLFGDQRLDNRFTVNEKEIIRLAARRGKPITPGDVCKQLNICRNFARKMLRKLVEAGVFVPESGEKRIRTYRLIVDGKRFFF